MPNGAEDGTYLLRNPAHRTANVAFQSVSELRALNGMDEELHQALRPYVCIGEAGAPTQFNINTARPEHIPVLAALLGSDQTVQQTAEALIQARPSSGYTADSLQAAPALEGVDLPGADFSAIIFAPQRVRVEAIINFGSAERVRLYGFEGVDSGTPRLTYKDWGWDNLHPQGQFWLERWAARADAEQEPSR